MGMERRFWTPNKNRAWIRRSKVLRALQNEDVPKPCNPDSLLQHLYFKATQ